MNSPELDTFPPSAPLTNAGKLLPWNLKLVPAEPTLEMIRAALDCQDAAPEDGAESEMYYAYLAMLAAAPAQQIAAPAVGYLLRTQNSGVTELNTVARHPNGDVPPGWSEEPVFTAQSVGLPFVRENAPPSSGMSGQLLKTLCEGLLGEKPILTREMAEELFMLFRSAANGRNTLTR